MQRPCTHLLERVEGRVLAHGLDLGALEHVLDHGVVVLREVTQTTALVDVAQDVDLGAVEDANAVEEEASRCQHIGYGRGGGRLHGTHPMRAAMTLLSQAAEGTLWWCLCL